jgi:hypothetical protein
MERFIKFFALLLLISYGHLTAQQIKPSVVIVKLKEGKSISDSKYFETKYNIKVKSFSRLFPYADRPKTKTDRFGHKLVDLSRFYELRLENAGNEKKLAEKISNDAAVEYAEPYYLPQPLYTPNDPKIPSQYALNA